MYRSASSPNLSLTSYERVDPEAVDEDVVLGLAAGEEFSDDVEVGADFTGLVQHVLRTWGKGSFKRYLITSLLVVKLHHNCDLDLLKSSAIT